MSFILQIFGYVSKNWRNKNFDLMVALDEKRRYFTKSHKCRPLGSAASVAKTFIKCSQ